VLRFRFWLVFTCLCHSHLVVFVFLFFRVVCYVLSTEFWGFKGNGNDPGLWLKWMMLVANTSDVDVPKVFSCSYGEDEYTMANDYADRVNIEFVKAGVRGISILVASGDSGAANQNSKCPHNKMFTPKWPAASPYITSVGGTGGNGNWETAADLSSGGFSNRYSAPKWQKEAVASYLSSSKLPNKTKHSINNTKGRGFPDVVSGVDVVCVVCVVGVVGVVGVVCVITTIVF
jgi:tripeptidyl-peptidase-1